jgi:hypothetical protein
MPCARPHSSLKFPVSPLFVVLTHITRCNPFVFRSYAFLPGGSGCSSIRHGSTYRFASRTFSLGCKPLFQQLLSFLIYTNPWGGGHARPLTFPFVTASRASSPEFPGACALFVTENSRRFIIFKSLRTLFGNTGGVAPLRVLVMVPTLLIGLRIVAVAAKMKGSFSTKGSLFR